MTTKREVEALAKKLWGKRARIEERAGAATKAQREAASRRAAEIGVRRRQIESELAAAKWSLSNLLKQARFVVDVRGGNPSIDELEKELVKAEQHRELSDEAVALNQERTRLPVNSYRWSAGHIGTYIPAFCIEVEADTLDELAEKLNAKMPAMAT